MAIRVRNLQTGQTGMLVDERAFDPQKYEVIQPEQKSVGGFVKNVGTDLGENIKGIASLPKLLQQLVTSPVQTTKAVAKGVGGEYKDLLQQPVQTAYDKPISTILNILPFLQAGKIATAGKAGKVAKAGELGKAADIAKGVTTIAQDTKKAGALSKIGSKVEEAGKSLVLKELRPTPSQQFNFKKSTGKAIEDFATEKKIGSLNVENIENKLIPLQEAFDAKTVNSSKAVNRSKLIKAFDDVIKEVDTPEALAVPRNRQVRDMLVAERDNLKTLPEEIPLPTLVKIRRDFDKVTKDFKNADPMTASDSRLLGSIYRDVVNTTAGTDKMGKDLSSYYKLLEIAEKQEGLGKGSIGIGFKNLQGAVAGGASTGTLPGAAAGYAVQKALSNPRVTSAASRGLQATGKTLQGANMPDTLAKILQTGKNAELLKATPLKIGATSAVGRNVPQQAIEGMPTQEIPTPTPTIPTEPTELANTAGFPKITPEKLMMARLSLSPQAYKVVEDIYKIQKESEGGKDGGTEAEKAAKAASTLAGDALKLLQSKSIKTGLLNAPIQGGLAKIGAADQDTLEFNTLIAGLKASIAKARAGTSFTPNEEKLLNQYVPVVGDSKQQLETKLKILQTPQGQSVLNVLMNPDSQNQNQNPVDVLQNAGINLQ